MFQDTDKESKFKKLCNEMLAAAMEPKFEAAAEALKGAIELNLNHYHYTVPMYFVPLSLYSTHLLEHTPFYRLTPNQIDIKKPLIRSIF